MPREIDDLTGRVFGRLTVVEFARRYRRNSYWRVRCECGNEKPIQRSNLISGGTVSCGCHRDEQRHERCGKKSPVFKHGRCVKGASSHDYEVWKWATRNQRNLRGTKRELAHDREEGRLRKETTAAVVL
jgi:hypothetical protein